MAKKQHESTGTRALEVLHNAGISFHLHEYEHDPRVSSFGDETIEKLGIAAPRVFKTLIAQCDDGSFIVCVLPVDHQLSLKKAAKAAKKKSAVMADPIVAQRRTGYVVGGISPLGQLNHHETFIDESAFDHDSILVSGGKRGCSVELDPWILLELLTAEVADILGERQQ